MCRPLVQRVFVSFVCESITEPRSAVGATGEMHTGRKGERVARTCVESGKERGQGGRAKHAAPPQSAFSQRGVRQRDLPRRCRRFARTAPSKSVSAAGKNFFFCVHPSSFLFRLGAPILESAAAGAGGDARRRSSPVALCHNKHTDTRQKHYGRGIVIRVHRGRCGVTSSCAKVAMLCGGRDTVVTPAKVDTKM